MERYIHLDLLEKIVESLTSFRDIASLDAAMQSSKVIQSAVCNVLNRPEADVKRQIWADVKRGVDSILCFPKKVVCRNVRVMDMSYPEVISMLEHLMALKATVFAKVKRLTMLHPEASHCMLPMCVYLLDS